MTRPDEVVDTDSLDVDLLRRWRSGERGAGEQLVKRHHASIDRFFRHKVGDPAEDLVQETFFGLLKGHSPLRGEASVRTMLFAIAHHKLVDYFRANAKDLVDPAESSIADSMRSPPSLLEIHEQHKLLVAALRQLPLTTQCMLELHYWEKMSIKDISRILGFPKNTVKTHMHRGRQELDVAMQRLAQSPTQLVTTRRGLEGWSEELKHEVAELSSRRGADGSDACAELVEDAEPLAADPDE